MQVRESEPGLPARVALGFATAVALATGCGDSTAPPTPARVTVTPAVVIADAIGSTAQFAARVEDSSGTRLSGTSVAWSSGTPEVATVDPSTGLATAQAVGSTEITAEAGGVSGFATLEVFVPGPTVFVVGETYLGRQGYTEYRAGDLPIVVSAPHGGSLRPEEIPDRTFGTTAQDRRTMELARAIDTALFDRTGRRIHLIINQLHRIKLDANREIEEAAQGNAYAEWAWGEYHDFIEAAKQSIVEQYGSGLFLDLHGHGHDIQRLELGYLLRSADLELPDGLLESPELIDRSSIRRLVFDADASFVELLRGATSLGGLLAQGGFPPVPSPDQPDPDGAPYFAGGYNTRRHGSRDGGTISGIQVEAHWVGARDSASSRAALADALAAALETFMAAHFRIDLSAAVPTVSGAWWDAAQPAPAKEGVR